MTAQKMADFYLEQYEERAVEFLEKEIVKLNAQFDMVGYTPDELRKHKTMKEALKILKEYE